MANSQAGTIFFHNDLLGKLYDHGIFNPDCNLLEPKQHSCWNSGKLHCDYDFNCINENCIKINPNASCSAPGEAPFNVVPVKKGKEKVNFYASVSKNGCKET